MTHWTTTVAAVALIVGGAAVASPAVADSLPPAFQACKPKNIPGLEPYDQVSYNPYTDVLAILDKLRIRWVTILPNGTLVFVDGLGSPGKDPASELLHMKKVLDAIRQDLKGNCP